MTHFFIDRVPRSFHHHLKLGLRDRFARGLSEELQIRLHRFERKNLCCYQEPGIIGIKYLDPPAVFADEDHHVPFERIKAHLVAFGQETLMLLPEIHAVLGKPNAIPSS